MVVARLINLPDSLRAVGRVIPWEPEQFVRTLTDRQSAGMQVFGAAYTISTNGISMPKLRYLTDMVFTPLWLNRFDIMPGKGDSLEEFHTRLVQHQGMGSFMAAQVVADVKNTPRAGLDRAPDWWTWAAPGPGSLRGLNRILGNGASRSGLNAPTFLRLLNELRKHVNDAVEPRGWRPLCAQDVQNCLCEFDKYERARLGEGTPKQLFKPHMDTVEQTGLL
jgi:hypothetical protein